MFYSAILGSLQSYERLEIEKEKWNNRLQYLHQSDGFFKEKKVSAKSSFMNLSVLNSILQIIGRQKMPFFSVCPSTAFYTVIYCSWLIIQGYSCSYYKLYTAVQLIFPFKYLHCRVDLPKLNPHDNPLKGKWKLEKRNKYYRLTNDKLTTRRCLVPFVSWGVDTYKLN